MLTVGLTALSALPAMAQQAGDPVRTLVILAQPQAAAPQEFQAAEMVAEAWKQLGLQVQVRALPSQQFNQIVWYERQRWDATTWQMVGRPERSDPDELTYNLFVGANAANGYNFVGYLNPEYDRLAQAQREELDITKRKAVLIEAQELINRDQPYGFMVHPKNLIAYNATVWDDSTMKVQAGIGVRNFWTWIGLKPKGAQKDVILNSTATPTNLSPFNIAGAQGSWAAELVWDRLMRIGPDGLPQPWAAETVTRPTTTTVELTLRAGMKWHDGTPVTIDDAIFSLEAPGYGDKSPMYKPFVGNIAKVETIGPMSLRITLKRPDAAFLVSSLSKLNLASRKIWAPIFEDLKNKPETAETIMEKLPVGSGPFKFVSVKLNEQIVLEANPDHWAKPLINRWIMRITPNIEASLGAMKSGELNVLADYTGDPELLMALPKSNPNIKIADALDMGIRFIAYNERRQPFGDVAFRRAISAAIDRDAIAADAYGGAAVASNSWVSPALAFWAAPGIAKRVPGGTVAAAKQMLKDAGYVLVNGRLHYPVGVKETTAAYQ
ncbi:MAG: twin-arginine translocation pathway signal protein [Acetobacteraceae bacterium]|nr:twin-arginine translocation pathway signal protein [Acetobacteraceae bacterium]